MTTSSPVQTSGPVQAPTSGPPSRPSQTLLAAVGALLALNLLVQLAALAPAAAHAQSRSGPEPAAGVPTNVEMTRRVAEQLADVNARLARIESRLAGPLDVKVTQLPPGATVNAAPPQ